MSVVTHLPKQKHGDSRSFEVTHIINISQDINQSPRLITTVLPRLLTYLPQDFNTILIKKKTDTRKEMKPFRTLFKIRKNQESSLMARRQQSIHPCYSNIQIDRFAKNHESFLQKDTMIRSNPWHPKQLEMTNNKKTYPELQQQLEVVN